MNHKSRLLISLLVLGLLVNACQSSNEETPKMEYERFAIYLLDQDITGREVFQHDLDELKLATEPFITDEDIIYYDSETGALELTDNAMARLFYTHYHGQPFIVCVGSDRIYSGVFWDVFRSSLWAPIMIDLPLSPEQDSTRICTLLAEEDDPTSDQRILKSLEQAGKLR